MKSDTIKESGEEKKVKKQLSCEHTHWITKCSICGAILDSENMHDRHTMIEVEL